MNFSKYYVGTDLKRCLALLVCLTTILSGQSYGQEVVGQLVHWNFDEATGDTVFDSSGSNKHAVLINGPIRIAGKSGNAVYFDGVDDYAPFESLYPSSPASLTVSLWIKCSDSIAGVAIYHGRNGEWAVGAGDTLCWTNVKPECCDWHQITSPVGADLSWHHLAMTWIPGDALRLYFDGKEKASRSVPNSLLLDPSWNNFHPAIGAYTELPTVRDFFRGAIDETAVYDRAFSAEEIWIEYRRLGFKPGDADGDEMISVTDAVFLINFIFANGISPIPVQAGDPNCDGKTNISDAVYLINYIFAGGEQPCDSAQT